MYGTFPERFNQIVSEYEGSGSELAARLNVSKQTISAWRNGTRSPKTPTIAYIAQYFNISVPWLMGLDVPRGHFTDSLSDGIHLTTEETDLIIAYRAASPAIQAAVHAVLSSEKSSAASNTATA